MEENNKILIYTDGNGLTKIDVKLEDNTLWLTQAQMCELYQTSKSNVSEHIKHIFEEGELQEDAVVRKFRTTASDGKLYLTTFYNLDMIIALGYRVRSIIATRFRQWATERLKEYIVKGFTLDDERLKKLGGGGYWKELLERIRDIRATEKVLYRQVLEIYATSIDYDPRASVSQEFFKKVQNKIHYAIHGRTAAELIVERADAEKDFMGLLTFKLGRKRSCPLQSGRIEIWATASVYTICSINFMFSKSSRLSTSSFEIAEHFGASGSTIAQKSKVIKDLLKISNVFDPNFSLKEIADNNPFNHLVMRNGFIFFE